MISRAARVPRICLACRFGLITQRSAGSGLRTNPVRQGLGQRLYTSDIGRSEDYKVQPFVSSKDVAETTSEEKSAENESTTTIPPKNATGSTNSDSATEIDSGSTRTPGKEVIGSAQTELDDRLNEVPHSAKDSSHAPSELSNSSESSSEPPSDSFDRELDELLNEPQLETSPPKNPSHSVSELPDLPGSSSGHRSGSVFELDELLDEDLIRKEQEFGISELPRLDDGPSGGVRKAMPWPKRRFRDVLMHEESLGVSSLGLPADAIVINNPNKTRIERKAPIVIEEEEIQPTNIDWESLNPSESIEPAVDEITANIEEFRPDVRILRLTDIEALIESLCSGFTINQLKDYHRDCEPEQKEGEIVNYSWIEESVPWASINSTQVRGNDKIAIAQKIVFDKWGIEVMEYENDLGRAYVWMDPDVFPFLLYGPNNTSRLLWELRRDFLVGEDEKLTLTIQKSRLNITARKSTTYGILAYMDQCLQKMRTRTIDVAPFLPAGMSSPTMAEIKELGRLTKTSIKRIKEGTKEKYRVSWLPDSDDVPAKTEDLADIVFRLMVGLTVPGTNNVLQCIPSKGEDEVGGQLVQVRRNTRAMSWRDKLGQWFRVVDPITKSQSVEESLSLNLAASADLPQSKGPRDHDDSTTATFGHILHSEPLDSMKLLARQRRILSPFSPHLAAFSALKPDNNKPLKESTTIVMNLVPHKERKRGRGSDAQKGTEEPAVRIKIPVKPDADFENFSLPDDLTAQCFATWHVSDVLLPAEAVDVRIQHERANNLALTDRHLQTFLQASQFNLAEGKLRTPAQARLNIPGLWLKGSRTGYDLAKNERHLYDFRGTEIHRTVDMPWRKHILRYSSIEAGQQGGQRQEITLIIGPKKLFNNREERQQNFLQLVEDMATGKCFSWYEGHQSIKSRQLEDYSYNLPAEKLPEDVIVEHKFDARGRPRSHEDEKKKRQQAAKPQRAANPNTSYQPQAPSRPGDEPILDDIDKLLAAENESGLNVESKVEEEPVQDTATQELMSILDTLSDSKASTKENIKQTLPSEKGIKDEAPESSTSDKDIVDASPTEKVAPTKSKMTAAAAERERLRTEITNNFFGAEELSVESPATTKMHKPSAARKAKVAARKYTVPDLKQPTKKDKAKAKVEEDPFTAQFAARATSNNRVADPGAPLGFFDTLPSENESKTQKKSNRWDRRGSAKKSGKK
ncbi:hypothetical protein FLONG3_3191 [Fusarium longipes]|uniref:Uncharacterized protein n=1 Tax=Fusarium longipes TaxID=694270 RepID=A0A395T1Q1_9HYPO|nr:hypothetical protein FLONG3_3191 [Fusarium longipes]